MKYGIIDLIATLTLTFFNDKPANRKCFCIFNSLLFLCKKRREKNKNKFSKIKIQK